MRTAISLPDPLTVFRWKFRILALICTAGSAILTWKFGVEQSTDREIAIAVAAVLCCFSLASDYVWLFVREAWRRREYGMTAVCAFGGAALLGLNLLSNLGAVGWQRDAVTAQTQNREMKHTVAATSAGMSAEKRAQLERLAADLRAMHPWAATTTAEALRKQIAAKKADTKLEAAIVRCATECRRLQREVADLERQLGVVEQRENYDEQLAEIERQLKAETKVMLATNDERTVDAPVAQAALFASFREQTLEPSTESKAWMVRNVAGVLAVGLVIGPALFSLIGFGGSRRRDPVSSRTVPNPTPLVPIVDPVPLSAGSHPGQTIVHQRFNDARFARAAADLLAPYRRERPALTA
jgi:hypothetical protein